MSGNLAPVAPVSLDVRQLKSVGLSKPLFVAAAAEICLFVATRCNSRIEQKQLNCRALNKSNELKEIKRYYGTD